MLVADSLAENIRKLRQRRGLTQEALAERVHVARTTVVAWEAGRSSPQAADLPGLVEALGVSVAELYDEPRSIEVSAQQPQDASLTYRVIRAGEVTGSGSIVIPGPRVSGSGTVTPRDPSNVSGRVEDLRDPGARRLPIYRWGSLGDPTDHDSAPSADREEYPPLGRESLIGPRGFGVEVRGTSMEGKNIHDGDIVWVNPDKSYRLGQIVLASLSDGEGESGMVVKTYARTEFGEGLLSELAGGKEPVVSREYHIIGPVVWIERGFPPP